MSQSEYGNEIPVKMCSVTFCSHTLLSVDNWDVRKGLQWVAQAKNSCVPFSAAFLSPSFYHWCAQNTIWSQRRSVVVLDEEADRTPEEASRINPGLKGMESAKENPSCWQMSFEKLGQLRHHVTDPSLEKQHCQKSIPETSWIKQNPYRPLQDEGSP